MTTLRVLDGQNKPLISPVEKLGSLERRLTTASRLVESVAVARELRRIALELAEVREFLEADDDTRAAARVRLMRSGRSTVRAKNPAPDTRVCSKCRHPKPLTAFAFSDKKKNKLRSECMDCFNAGQRERYVRVGYKMVTVEVLESDPCCGHPCPACGEPMEPGQLVTAKDVCHAQCVPTE